MHISVRLALINAVVFFFFFEQINAVVEWMHLLLRSFRPLVNALIINLFLFSWMSEESIYREKC
jgi:hypothetical protein